jgi:hypothetical protein
MDPIIELFWQRFRKWDVTSERLKSANDGWKRRTIVLTLAGTAFGALAPFSGVEGGSPWPPRVLAVVGTVCLALATYFARELLDSKHEERRTRARTAAEAFKSETCKYLAQAPPYHGADRSSHAQARLRTLKSITKGQVPALLSDTEATEGMPGGAWSIEDYVGKRLDDQISWYRRRAGDHSGSMRKGRAVTLTLGVLAVLLSAATGAAARTGTLPAALLGVVTTAAGAIGAYLQASHFESLAVRYSETADALERLRVEFTTTPAALRQQLVADAEAIMQSEQAAWLSERTAEAL